MYPLAGLIKDSETSGFGWAVGGRKGAVPGILQALIKKTERTEQDNYGFCFQLIEELRSIL